MSPRWRTWLLMPFVTAALLLGAELGARLDDLLRYDVPFFAVLDGGYDLTVRDSVTVHGRPYGSYKKIHLNAAGFRGPPIAAAVPAGCTRVLVLGASESVAGGEQGGTEYSAYLQRALPANRCYEVQNAAVSGFDLPRITTLWTHWAWRWTPDVVVIYPTPSLYLLPDAPAYPAKALKPMHRPPRWRLRLADRLEGQSFWPAALERWKVRRDIARAVAAHAPDWEYRALPLDRLALYERDLDSLVLAIEARGAHPVLVTHAMRFGDPPAPEDELLLLKWQRGTRASARVLLDFERAANLRLVAVARRRGAAVVDAAGRLSGRRELFADYTHFNTDGRAALGMLIAGSLQAYP